MPLAERTKQYIELGKKWAAGHKNRMIKVPATPGGLAALEELARRRRHAQRHADLLASGSTTIARDAIWRGAERRKSLDGFKSVYSIFVSRVDVYTEKHVPRLVAGRAGQVGIVNAKRIWQLNQQFWADKKLPLQAGDDLRQHRHEEARRPAVEVRRGVRRLRHRDEPAGHERGRRRPAAGRSPGRSTRCRRRTCSPRSTRRWTCSRWKRR